MGHVVVEILRQLQAVLVTDVTIVEVPKVAASPRVLVAFEQMRARGELKLYSASCGARSMHLTMAQYNALVRAGAKAA